MLENVWIKLDIKNKHRMIDKITKSDIFLMKSMSIGFFMSEIDFTVSENYDIKKPIDIEIELDGKSINLNSLQFSPSEINTMAIKNGEYITPIKVVLEPEPYRVRIIAFPFEKNAHYELNIQMIIKFNVQNRTSIRKINDE